MLVTEAEFMRKQFLEAVDGWDDVILLPEAFRNAVWKDDETRVQFGNDGEIIRGGVEWDLHVYTDEGRLCMTYSDSHGYADIAMFKHPWMVLSVVREFDDLIESMKVNPNVEEA